MWRCRELAEWCGTFLDKYTVFRVRPLGIGREKINTFPSSHHFLNPIVSRKSRDERAYVGTNRLRIYWQIVMPLARPALLTVGLITFMGSWNSLLWPLIIAQSEEMQTPAIGVGALGPLWRRGVHRVGALMAATLLSLLPIMIIYIFLQNSFMALRDIVYQ